MIIRTRRVYDAPAPGSEDGDGLRILIDRLWPRGIAKQDAPWDHWCKAIAPSTELRKWFGHDPRKFEAFSERYRAELDGNPDAVSELLDLIRGSEAKVVTLLYAAKDTEHNHAPVLAAYLRARCR